MEGQTGTGESVPGRGEVIEDILGKERLRKSLEVRRIKMSRKHRAVVPKLAPQKVLFGKASKGGRKDVFQP